MADNELKKPIDKGVAKVPVIMQLEALECGAASLAMVLAYYGKWLPLEQVRCDCGVSRDGSSALNVLKAARGYGLKAQGYKLEPEDLKKEGKFPCIIHWNFNHFVVLDGFKGDKVYLNDPAKGAYSVSMETFDESFTGVTLMFEPAEGFVPDGRQKNMWSYVKKRFTGLSTPLVFTMLTTLITSLVGIISPVFNRIFYDRLLTGKNPEWFGPFLLALGLLYVLQLAAAFLNANCNLKINGKIHVVGALSYMWKVLHLPMNFFTQRMAGDIDSRQLGNVEISNTLVNTIAPMALNSVMMVFYLFVMLRYSWILTLIGVVSVTVNMIVSNYISRRRVNLTRVMSRDMSKLYSATVSGVQMIETIKCSGAEDGFFEKWAGCYGAVNASEQKFEKDNFALTFLPAAISSLAGSLILGIGVYLAMTGEFTLGSITAFQGFFTAFIAPAQQLISANQTIIEMRTQMERIEDVMEYPEDENIKDIETEEGETVAKLSGDVEISHITFGYSKLAEPLIKDFSMSIKRGSCVAFVGASGCGKSTLSRLISGLYSPWEGEILFDGKRVSEIDHSIFTGSLAVVDQDIILFEDTIANNIKMWDDSIEDFEMILAAKDAQIHYDIISRTDGYQHMLTEGGKEFSGGQRQRLEIARVLAQEPNIIILDEATSALDAKTEFDVVKAIKDRGITCIVIAHRLSTIRDCDEIVVLDKGNVVERGTHEELFKLNGYYTELVTSD